MEQSLKPRTQVPHSAGALGGLGEDTFLGECSLEPGDTRGRIRVAASQPPPTPLARHPCAGHVPPSQPPNLFPSRAFMPQPTRASLGRVGRVSWPFANASPLCTALPQTRRPPLSLPSSPASAAFPEWVSMTGPYAGIQSCSGEAAVEPWGCFRLCLGLARRSGRVGGVLWAAGLHLPHGCLIPNGIKNRAPAKANKCRFYPAHSAASPPVIHVPSGPPTCVRFLCVSWRVPAITDVSVCVCVHVSGAHSLIPQILVRSHSVLFSAQWKETGRVLDLASPEGDTDNNQINKSRVSRC